MRASCDLLVSAVSRSLPADRFVLAFEQQPRCGFARPGIRVREDVDEGFARHFAEFRHARAA